MAETLLYFDDENFSGFLSADSGFKVERNDVDGPNAGRLTMDAYMERDYIATKAKIYAKCRVLTDAELQRIMGKLSSTYIRVSYLDYAVGLRRDVQMTCTQTACEYMFRRPDGARLWKNFTFNLVER